MADRLSQYPMLSNFNSNILQQQQLQQQPPSQQLQDSHSILPPSTLDQAMIWQQMQMQQQFRPHGAVEMNSHAPSQVRISPFLFSHLSDRNRRRRGSALTLSFRLISLLIPPCFFSSTLIMFILTFSLRI